MVQRFSTAAFDGLLTVTEGRCDAGGINFFDDTFCLTKLVEKPSLEQLEALEGKAFSNRGTRFITMQALRFHASGF